MLWAAALSLAAWLYLLGARGWFWRMREDPPAADPPEWRAGRPPAVAAVIPARNEAAVVARAIGSLAGQKYEGRFHIVLVDDGSTDGTAEAARAAAPRELLTVVEAAPLPAGWTGKMWAVAEGVRQAARFDPEWLLLTDADIEHAPGSLRQLAARAGGGFDLVSYMATLHCGPLAEQTLIPAFVFFFFMLYPPRWIADPRRATAGAAGGCMLVRRAALESIGGVAAIGGALIDDCALARAIKRSGGRVWLGLDSGTRSMREYATFGEIGRMISRTAFTQLGHSWWLLAGTVVGLALVYLAPPVCALAASGTASTTALAAWLLMAIAYAPAVRYYRLSPFRAALLPVAAAFYLASTIHSAAAWRRGAGGMWKGRVQDRANP